MGSCCSSDDNAGGRPHLQYTRARTYATQVLYILAVDRIYISIHAGGGPDRLDREVLAAHNAVRSKHGSPALRWSPEAAQAASRWAARLAKIGEALSLAVGR